MFKFWKKLMAFVLVHIDMTKLSNYELNSTHCRDPFSNSKWDTLLGLLMISFVIFLSYAYIILPESKTVQK